MGISPKLMDYMNLHQVQYDVFRHPRSASSMETIRVAQIPGEQLAKSVILEDDDGYLMAVVPANARRGRCLRWGRPTGWKPSSNGALKTSRTSFSRREITPS